MFVEASAWLTLLLDLWASHSRASASAKEHRRIADGSRAEGMICRILLTFSMIRPIEAPYGD
jgi:hypothetical protein